MTKLCDTIEFYTVHSIREYQSNAVTLTRRAYKAIGGLGNYLDIANWMCMWNR